MRLREKLFWLCAGTAFIILVFSLVPSHYPICKEGEKAQQESCPSYQVVPFVVIKVVQILDKMGGVITALATIAIACFTLTLKRATDKLWDAGERQLKLLAETSAAQSRDMQASIIAAQQSADAAMLAIGSDRAWFTVEQVNVGEASNGKIGDREFARAVFARITWKNTGRSPSLNTSLCPAQRVIPFNDEAVPVFMPDWPTVGGALPVGPGSTTTTPPYPLVDLERDALFNREIALVVYSAIKYFDVFTPRVERVSEVCCKIMFDGSVIDQTTGQIGHNWMIRAFGPQNTAT